MCIANDDTFPQASRLLIEFKVVKISGAQKETENELNYAASYENLRAGFPTR